MCESIQHEDASPSSRHDADHNAVTSVVLNNNMSIDELLPY